MTFVTSLFFYFVGFLVHTLLPRWRTESVLYILYCRILLNRVALAFTLAFVAYVHLRLMLILFAFRLLTRTKYFSLIRLHRMLNCALIVTAIPLYLVKILLALCCKCVASNHVFDLSALSDILHWSVNQGWLLYLFCLFLSDIYYNF
jgi:hypothetical protein